MAAEIDVLRTIVGLSLLVCVAKVLGGLLAHFKYPRVAGEVLAGIVFGPLTLGGAINIFGGPLIEFNDLYRAFALMGGIFLLFAAGLEFKISDLKSGGLPALVVASIGVIVPLGLGYAVPVLLGYPSGVAILIGATLTATSIAVTVRTLEEIKQLHSVEARLLVNAAIIDDVLGLSVLTAATSYLGGQIPDAFSVIWTVGLLLGLWLLLLGGSAYILPRIINLANRWEGDGNVEATATAACFGLAAVAATIGLSPFVGAFSAGMAVASSKALEKVKDYTKKVLYILGPIFFAVIGALINFAPVVNTHYFLIVLVLAVAVVSKIIGCGIPAALYFKDADKGLRVGVGMASRGEVGIIIAGLGLALGVFPSDIYAALITVVLATTLVGPALLRRAFTSNPLNARLMVIARMLRPGASARP